LIVLALGPFVSQAKAGDDHTLCTRYHFTKPVKPGFTSAETALVCGTAPSSDGALKKSRSWALVPSSQAILSITAFLQSRGYLKAKIRSSGRDFQIDPGAISRVSQVKLEGAPKGLDFRSVTQHGGEILTPNLMTDIEQKAKQLMMSHGYPCADAKSEANSDSGTITLHVRAGLSRRIGKVKATPIPNSIDGLLSRYYAFKPGDLYDDRLLAISADRAISAGVVEDTYFVPSCNDVDEVDLTQQVRAGAPRIFTLGFDIDTEEIGRISLSLRNARVGRSASDAEMQISASSKIQYLTAFYQDYFLPTPSRQWIRPLVRVMHENENPFEIVQELGQIRYGTSVDVANTYAQLSVGPEFSNDHTLQGLGPKTAHALFLSAEARLTSHQFEFNHNAARGGSELIARAEASSASAGSQFSARRFVMTGDKFWRPGPDENPGTLVIRTRLGWRTTGYSGDGPGVLPPDFRHYLGGEADLRGFGRMELPGNSVGGLSAWFGNLELRPHLWDNRIEPIAFADIGELGEKSFLIRSPLYWSPGVGISWITPIGTLQSTIAHGYVSGGDPASLSHWQFYLSLGGAL
jgi:translocation and assembly module TamA